ncbi:emp24/gp25L/p24 family/GOLD-domain-containing protein [Emericellopsis atlantica]|uniref:Emp24/gp25L/p24 family/GOLD-domain-containing protein n=1 Tax=Emericellopsis atlantica TaxID=2614577 RepID=A0A9P8CJV1_9HYPO|nr:emp24/gp25L/p24 family/GOLD-domain-containing protein [Emericellopsis atlantica]KAG9249854.1 emp24/gp25L/p24 family/GOLD-domain-containing protein [Emericellopsis atlantica]
MRFFTAAKALVVAAVAASAHNIVLPAHGVECFYETLHKDDTMTVTFQVGDREFGSAGNLEIDFWIINPSTTYEYNVKSVTSGDYTFTAKHDGRFSYCFGNQHWGANTKEVSFNVHGVVYVNEADMPSDPLEKEVRTLSDLLAQVKDEQQYIVIRERTHRNTAESTNSRVKWWNLFIVGVVVGESMFQVWWLKRFFEVKRTV